jgi:hypothetical protein
MKEYNISKCLFYISNICIFIGLFIVVLFEYTLNTPIPNLETFNLIMKIICFALVGCFIYLIYKKKIK